MTSPNQNLALNFEASYAGQALGRSLQSACFCKKGAALCHRVHCEHLWEKSVACWDLEVSVPAVHQRIIILQSFSQFLFVCSWCSFSSILCFFNVSLICELILHHVSSKDSLGVTATAKAKRPSSGANAWKQRWPSTPRQNAKQSSPCQNTPKSASRLFYSWS